MAKELIELGELHSADNGHSTPRLFFNNRLMTLSHLKSNPQIVFDRIQYRLCSLPSSQTDFPSLCKDNYRIDLESIVINIWMVEF